MIDPHSRVRQATGMLQSAVDGEVVAMSIDRGMCYGLNNIGSDIWRLLESWTTVEEISSTLVTQYEVDAATCQSDVRRLLTELAEEGLIEVQAA